MNATMPRPPRLVVLYEDNHLLVVAKPAGLPTQGVSAGADSVVTLAREYLKRKYGKPGNVYLGVVSRIDSPVSGVIALARTSKAARRLNEQFRARTVQKHYWALVEGRPPQASGTLDDWLQWNESVRRSQVVEPGSAAAQEARLLYRRLKAQAPSGISWLEVELHTGRKHQIRAQLAHRGWPVVGDRRYGSRRTFAEGIALHARSLVLVHPTRGDTLSFSAPPPACWNAVARLM